jgi:6-phosphogluconate dehydrogenase
METMYRERSGLTVPGYVEDTGEVNWLVEDALHMEVPIRSSRSRSCSARLARREAQLGAGGRHDAPRLRWTSLRPAGRHRKGAADGRVGGFVDEATT